MLSVYISWIAVGLLLAASIGLLLSRDWRWSLGLLAVQYFGMFWLVSLYWPFGLASVKLVTGWMASATLGVTRLGMGEEPQSGGSGSEGPQRLPALNSQSLETLESGPVPQGRLFRLLAAFIVIVLVVAITPQAEAMIPGISRPVIAGGLLLAGMGLLHLGLSAEALRVTLGLLTVMTGFELLYAAVETSILLAGLLSIVNLGLALTGAYLVTCGPVEEAGDMEEVK